MSSQPLNNLDKVERIDPIQERVGEGMFTDREAEMASLMVWVEKVAQKYGRSRALVSHRRHGKTAILERLYNRLFWEQTDVMPFYFELGDDIRQIWLRDLAELYLFTFLQQFLAYRTRDATLAFNPNLLFDDLYQIAEHTGETLVQEAINYWRKDDGTSMVIKIARVLHKFPHYFAVQTGISIIVMFDEFQRLNQVVYYDEACTDQCHEYTNSYSAAAESSRAPMLIAGSQVTVLTEQALSGAMLGRVGTKYIERLPLVGAVELVLKFAQRRNLDISLNLAYTISRLVDGHPYYIWCLFNSEHIESDLTTEEGIQETLTFEVENREGYINDFWQRSFLQNIETFDSPYAKEIILYLTQYPDREVYVEQICQDLGLPISTQEATQLLRQLIWCDLARQRSRGFYGGLSDPMLARVLRIEYGWEIEQLMRDEAIQQMRIELVNETIASQKELINRLKSELSHLTH